MNKPLYNETRAINQGWILAGVDSTGLLEIQAADDVPDGIEGFESDRDALNHVKSLAAKGDVNAQNALKAIADSLMAWQTPINSFVNDVLKPVDPETERALKRKHENKVARQKIALGNREYVTVCWEECDELQQDLIVALFNNHAMSLGPDRDDEVYWAGGVRLWCDVIIHHPVFLEEEHPLACWDATAERRNGVLEISGHQGPGGSGLYHTVSFPKNVIVSVKAVMER